MSELVTSNDYAHPRRPLGVRLLDGLGSLLGYDQRPLTREGLMKAARRQTGLSDFGDPFFVAALDTLLASINREAKLTSMGRIAQKERLLGLLVNRLRAEALFKAHPEILEQELLPPLVIAALQRTGTTMLHRLLAADPNARSLIAWEALNPAPIAGDVGDSKRRAKARRAERALAYIAPEFFAIHPVEADAPEEDILLLELSFMSQVAEATMHVPTYARWLEEQDATLAYRYLRRLLLLLQWQRGGRHWVLKTPHHLEFLDVLMKVFPRAKVIQTHRDPLKTMGSFCSMVAHGRGVFSQSVDASELAEHWVRKLRRVLERSMAARADAPAGVFLDVAYADLIQDPEAQVRRIYAFAGLDYGSEVHEAVQATRERNKRHKYGKHAYHLEDFGLDRAGIDAEFALYREHYAIVRE
jgi:hypothetical protein